MVVVSPDGKNVYVGDFFGNAVASFSRAEGSGALTQLAGTAGCIADGATEGCATGVELGSIEGLAVNRERLRRLRRGGGLQRGRRPLTATRETGALSQSTERSGCITDAAVTGCALGYELAGANAVAISTERRRRLRDLAVQQQPHHLPPDARAASGSASRRARNAKSKKNSSRPRKGRRARTGAPSSCARPAAPSASR